MPDRLHACDKSHRSGPRTCQDWLWDLKSAREAEVVRLAVKGGDYAHVEGGAVELEQPRLDPKAEDPPPPSRRRGRSRSRRLLSERRSVRRKRTILCASGGFIEAHWLL